jgi:hypothetical protein
MDLEFQQLDLRYEELRGGSAARERRLLSSLAELGQQTPIVVVRASEVARHVVIDGYKRVRLLRKLGQDTVQATAWDLGEAEALLLERMLRASFQAEGTSRERFFQPHGATSCSGTWGHPRGGVVLIFSGSWGHPRG